MQIEQPADGDTSWGNEVRAAIAAVNALEGVTAANLPETIRDTIGSTVVGTGLVTVTPSDVADTVTVATTATANSSDATLLNRANHTGTQVFATLSDGTEAVQDIVGAMVVAGTNISTSYNDAAGTLTISGSGGAGGLDVEGVQDVIGSAVVAGPGIAVSYNDTAGTLTVSTPGTPQTVTYAATITPNAAAGNLFRCTATGNLTLNDPIGGVDGQTITVEILASGADRTLNFAGGATAVTIPSGQWWSGALRLNGSTWLLADTIGGSGGSGGSGGGLDPEAVDDRVAALLVAGTNVTKTYDDIAGTLTIGTAFAATGDIVVVDYNQAFPTGLADGTVVVRKRGPSITEAWTGTTGAAWPAAWTVPSGTATIQTNVGRMVTGTTAYVEARGTRIGPDAGDLRVKVRFTLTGERYGIVYFRHTTTGNTYRAQLNNTGINMVRMVGGVSTTIAATVAFATAINTWYWMRVRWEGSDLRAKVWADGGTEPGTWQVAVTDTSHTTGLIGLGTMPGADNVQKTYEFDDLTVVDLA